MEFKVCLDQFEGPLDLMLHLVRSSQLDLFELNLDVLASQYCAYIHEALKQALDVSSEYLVEFSSLLEYKSKKLLPKPCIEDDPESTYEEDPAEQLARRLREYEKCKAEAEVLARLYEKREKRLSREPSSQIDEWASMVSDETPLTIAPNALASAFLRVLRRHQLLQPYQTKVEVKELSVEERMAQILNMEIFTPTPFRFEQLLDKVTTLHEAIVTFLAVLELVHEGSAAVFLQEKTKSKAMRILPKENERTALERTKYGFSRYQRIIKSASGRADFCQRRRRPDPSADSVGSRLVPAFYAFRNAGRNAGGYKKEARGVELVRYGGSWKYVAKESVYPLAQKLYSKIQSASLTPSAMEVLSLVAYRQPITRVEIDEIRGVSSDATLKKLQARGLIETCGHLDTIGRPLLYQVSESFFDTLGISALSDLPAVEVEQKESSLLNVKRHLQWKIKKNSRNRRTLRRRQTLQKPQKNPLQRQTRRPRGRNRVL
ncbi:SMC-Scp complex subunit ScpB [Allobaculum sp. Allo2]|uniref:SMC-Scp complex subunit ScpB n=1 Tax=Allobaculum sp. Allo2 TaxID=2853432 RepID=UPI001F61515B|nr:SMC-Scp complex subunit ScpB [Allobaculum sp. Allo2]UNT92506.1 SMC-Scp complex subunit ScpB [Allobaculum sp. Allo2]